MDALFISVGSKREGNIANTAGWKTYTINQNDGGRESLNYGFLKADKTVRFSKSANKRV